MNILQCHQYIPRIFLDILYNNTDLLKQNKKFDKTLKTYIASYISDFISCFFSFFAIVINNHVSDPKFVLS